MVSVTDSWRPCERRSSFLGALPLQSTITSQQLAPHEPDPSHMGEASTGLPHRMPEVNPSSSTSDLPSLDPADPGIGGESEQVPSLTGTVPGAFPQRNTTASLTRRTANLLLARRLESPSQEPSKVPRLDPTHEGQTPGSREPSPPLGLAQEVSPLDPATTEETVVYDDPMPLGPQEWLLQEPDAQQMGFSDGPPGVQEDDPGGDLLCDIGLEERLVKTYPIWFLPDLQRSGALHLLQGKDEGCFLVRGSSRSDTLAISVRLPPEKSPPVQHYLVEILLPQGKYSLESSDRLFDSLPALLSHHCNSSDELPVRLKLPKCVQEAKTRHELASIALLGQEFWGTPMASESSTQETTEDNQLGASHPSRPHDISFSSFGKGGVHRGSLASITSPQGFIGSHFGGSTTSLTPTRPAPPIPSPADRATLNLNLAHMDDFIKENTQAHVFSSFRSQPNTPITPLKPNPPIRTSPSSTQFKPGKPCPPKRYSPSSTALKDQSACSSPSDSIEGRQAPQPPQRSNKSPFSSSNTSPSGSNITVTTTLTFNVNQVKPLNIPLGDEQEKNSSSNTQINSDPSDHSFQVQVSSLEISPCGAAVNASGNPVPMAGVMNTCRDGLKLHIRPTFTSPQSTPCTPATPLTPLDTPLSEEGDTKVRLRRERRDRRRYSNHYHEANIIDGTCYRSSLADKISDYEDLWSSPPRDGPNEERSSLVGDPSDRLSSPHTRPYLSSFKPRNEISKSMGDLSDINQGYRCDPPDVNGVTNLERNSIESIDSNRKTSSPFYVEPVDALREHEKKNAQKKTNRLTRKIANRFSDSNIQWKPRQKKRMQKIDSNENLNCISSSFEDLTPKDNLLSQKNAFNLKMQGEDQARHSRGNGRGKAIAPPRISHPHKLDPPWRLDSSWEYLNYGDLDGELEGPCDGKFPLEDRSAETDSVIIPGDLTVQSLINEKLPILSDNRLSRSKMYSARNSEYDNLKNIHEDLSNPNDNDQNHSLEEESLVRLGFMQQRNSQHRISQSSQYMPSTGSDSGTEFSEPWDSRKWETIMQDESVRNSNIRRLSNEGHLPISGEDFETGLGVAESESIVQVAGDSNDDSGSSLTGQSLSFNHGNSIDTSLRSRILSPQMLALRHRKDAEGGSAIRTYALDLGSDSSTTFSQAVSNFITCTLESTESDPAVVVRNARQFMSGMKNYLVTSGEKQFEAIVKRERSNLKATEFLNLDAILEDVLVRLVLRPLWSHVNKLYVEAYTTNGSIQKLMTNMKYAKTLPCWRLGIRPEIVPPHGPSLGTIQHLLSKMQHVFAPREKLGHLLRTISHIYHSMYENGGGVPATGDADDLVPMIMWVLSHSLMVSAEVEADYMQGLLLPSSASGEASYYLNAFHSAIHALKNLCPSPGSSPGNSLDTSKQQDVMSVSDQGVMKIVVPDEKNGSIVTRTLPIRPGSTTREICKMMAHKLRVTNPQDFGLYKLVDGQESLLADNERPHKIRSELGSKGFHCLIAFKRTDSKIAWPLVNE